MLLLLAGAVVVGLLQDRDDPQEASPDRRTPSPSTSAESPSDPTPPTSTATVTETATEPAAEPAPAPSDDPAQAVADYYALLPEDTDTAWSMIASDEQQRIGRDSYESFWAGVDDVQVEDVESDGSTVTVELVYNGDDPETRQLVMEETDAGWVIAEDRGAV